MPLGTAHVTKTTADKFIPEIWSDEIVASYKKSLVLANLINKMNFKGKKGDTVHIPKPTRGSAAAKVASSQVTLQAATEDEVVVSIDKHYEYSRLIEDIVTVQALPSLRRFYTDDAGYALGVQVDSDIWKLFETVGDGTAGDFINSRVFTFTNSTGALIAYDGSVASTEGTFGDAGFRRAIQYLDDADVPMDGRSFVIPPSLRNTLMGTARYTEQGFTGEAGASNTIRNGRVGNLYGIEVYISNNAPSLESGATRLAGLFHRDAFTLVEQMGVRSQTQYKQEYLADLLTSDTLYGVKTIRPEAAVGFVVTA
jgi:N4-gp56 family major capsid protein